MNKHGYSTEKVLMAESTSLGLVSCTDIAVCLFDQLVIIDIAVHHGCVLTFPTTLTA